jgi:hypothetical protein
MTNQKRLNNITHNTYSDEWYTDQPTVDKCIELLNPTQGSTVLCPFDSKESLFVKTLINQGFKVIYEIDDFLTTDYEYDYIVTNPPFSIKDKVMKKVYESKKKAVLILPLDSLGGVKGHSLYREYGHPSIYIPTRRISYFDANWKKRDGSNFHSVILIFNSNEQSRIIWQGQTND